jgi:hypothetical protein
VKYIVLTTFLGSLGACASSPPSPAADASNSQTTPEAGDVLSNVTYEVSPNGVIPTCDSAQMCTFSWGSRIFAVDAKNGARIVKFSLSGNNILLTQAAGATEFGATFWPSPQTLWNWPPIATVDTGAYSVSIQGDVLVLTSGAFAIATGDPMMTIEKRFAVNSASNVVTITYAFINQGNSPVSVAPWEITRVAPGGVTFFPNPDSGPAPRTCSGTFSAPTTSDFESYTFFASLPGTGQTKLCADGGMKGYEAYLSGNLLLVQAWTDVPASENAAGEGEDEFYTDPNFTYEEVENQGPYAPVGAGNRAEWTVRWTLTSIAAVDGGIGPSDILASSSLRQEVEQVADSVAALQ